MTDTTVAALVQQGDRVIFLKESKEAAEDNLKEISGDYEEAKGKLLKMLEASDLPSFRHPGGKVFTARVSTTCRMPEAPERREALFDYLRAKELYDSFATIHWKKLSSWWSAERKVAAEGGDVDFQVPGIGPDEIVDNVFLEVR